MTLACIMKCCTRLASLPQLMHMCMFSITQCRHAWMDEEQDMAAGVYT